MKPWHLFTGYLLGAWLTFGYTSTLWGQAVTGAPNSRAEWDAVLSLLAAWCWPVYWFCKTSLWAFS